MSFLKKSADGKTTVEVTYEELMVDINKNLDTKLSATMSDFTTKKLPELFKSQIDPLAAQFGTINEALAKIATGGTPPPDPKDKVNDPQLNATLKQLQETVKSQGEAMGQLKKQKEEADSRNEKLERHGTIRSALSALAVDPQHQLNFVNPGAEQTAFTIIEPFVRRLEDNALVATINGENFPVNSFAKEYLEKEHAYLFKSSGSTGSGAPASGGTQRQFQRVDTDLIKPGMTTENRDAVVAAIKTAYANSQ